MAKPTGTVYLCANAVIDSGYSSTIDFKSPSEQQAYWGSLLKYSIRDFSYIRRTRQFIKVNKALKDLDDVNYMYFKAEEDSKLYYCFVTSKEYIDDSSSYIYFETDVLQSYMFDWELKPSYVLQEHVDRWTADHKPIYSRTDENLAYGDEYTTESSFRIRSRLDLAWYLAVVKPKHPVAEGGSSTDTTASKTTGIPYIYYLVPNAVATGEETLTFTYASNTSEGTPVASTIATIDTFMKVMKASLNDFTAQLVKLPYLPYDFEFTLEGEYLVIHIPTKYKGVFTVTIVESGDIVLGNVGLLKINALDEPYTLDNDGYPRLLPVQRKLAEMDISTGIESAFPTAEQWAEVKASPYNIPRDKRFESKLLCYPYRYNILTDWKNQPCIIKNEYIGGDKIKVNHAQGIGFNAPARYWVEGYRKDPEGRFNSLIQLYQEDVPIVTSAYESYMLQNRNQLQADRTNALTSSINNISQGTIAGGATGGVYGAVAGAVMGTASAVINYTNMIRSQNAKVKDLKNLPDNIVSNNDIAFSNRDNNLYVCLQRQKICCEFEEQIADVFNTSGYTVNRMKVPNLRSRLRYNYIKTLGANIVGSFNQEDLATIKAIFNNGVTFWHYNTVNFKPFDYSLENIETSLI